MICRHCLYEKDGHPSVCLSCGRPLGGRDREVPFVGREGELVLLDTHLEQVIQQGQPAFVVVSGADGVGRSRLMTEFCARNTSVFSEIVALRGYPTPRARFTDPFRPFGRLLHSAFRLDEQLPAAARLSRIRRQLDALDPPSLQDAVRGVCLFLALRPDGPEIAESPAEVRQRAFGVLTWYLRARAQRRPLLVVLEGMNQASSDGLAVLHYLRDELRDCPILILLETTESDAEALLPGADSVLTLSPLGLEGTAQLLRQVCQQSRPVAHELLARVHTETKGVPRDVVRVAEALQYLGVAKPDGQGWSIPKRVGDLDFALTPQEAAVRRLSGLSPETRGWLRRAAVVGDVFWPGALVPLARLQSGGAHPSMADAWIEDALVEAPLAEGLEGGLIERVDESTIPGEAEYIFTRDAERALLLSEVDSDARSRMHGMIAQWLSARAGHLIEYHFLRIAEHTVSSGRPDRAAEYFWRAGQVARSHFANAEAIEAFERAHSLLGDDDSLGRTELCHALGAMHAMAGRIELAESFFEEMLQAAWRLGQRAKAGAALNRLGRAARDRGDYDEATRLLACGQVLFAEAKDESGVVASTDDLGQVALLQGDQQDALILFEHALQAREAVGDQRGIALSLTNLARLRRTVGDRIGSEEALRQALTIRREIEDVPGLLDSTLELADLLLFDERYDDAEAELAAARDLAERTGYRSATARAMALSALCVSYRGTEESGVPQAREAIDLAEQLGDQGIRGRALRALAVALSTERPDEALEAAQRALHCARSTRDLPESAATLAITAQIEFARAIGPTGKVMGSEAHTKLRAAIKAASQALVIYDAISAKSRAEALRIQLANWIDIQGDADRAKRLRASVSLKRE